MAWNKAETLRYRISRCGKNLYFLKRIMTVMMKMQQRMEMIPTALLNPRITSHFRSEEKSGLQSLVVVSLEE
jgi:hypothetical protein